LSRGSGNIQRAVQAFNSTPVLMTPVPTSCQFCFPLLTFCGKVVCKEPLMSSIGRIFQINVSPAGGVPKAPVRTAAVDMLGIVGSTVANKAKHGGPQAALCLYALERILALQAEGHPLFPGSAGENLTITGLDWDAIAPGMRLKLGGDVLVELTRYTSPCQTIAASFRDGNFDRISQKTHPGWARVYAQVLSGGPITIGDPVVVQ